MFFNRKIDQTEARKLPRPVHNYMRYRFILLPEYRDTLRCFEFEVVFNRKGMNCVRIFSPYRAKE